MSKALLITWMCMATSMAQEADQTKTPPRLIVELTDGTQLLGAVAVEGVEVHTPNSAIQLTLRDIAHIHFDPDQEHVTVHLREGGEVSGVLETDVVSLSAAFQPRSLTVAKIQSIKVLEPIPHLDRAKLQRELGGTIQDWNSRTGEITIQYDFDTLAELRQGQRAL